MIFGCNSLDPCLFFLKNLNEITLLCLNSFSHCKSDDRPATLILSALVYLIEYEKEIATDEISIRIRSGEFGGIIILESELWTTSMSVKIESPSPERDIINAGINFIHNHPPAHPRGFAPKICPPWGFCDDIMHACHAKTSCYVLFLC